MKRTWWKEAVIYQIYPRSFKDSNADGIGDLRGIIEQLDYLQNLGVDIIWLSPIYQSPNDDNGYDISDYYSIMPEFGTMADFDEMLDEIHQRDMRLVMDLVVNHTSDEHEWFQKARKSKNNPYRDFYFWQETPPNNWQSFFGGPAWEYDEKAQAYYLHLFTKKQPDLNWENPKVRQEIYKMMRFWLDKGVDGFRMDVIPLISKRLNFPEADLPNFNQVIEEVYANGPRLHEFLQEMNREVLRHYDIMTVGEAPGVPPKLANLYVGENRKELNMIFHFGHMFLDHGEGGKFDVQEWKLSDFKGVFNTWDEAVGQEGWINIYLDNHDFPRLVSRWGNDGDYLEQSAKCLATLLMTLRGTPCIYQGTEIGMTNVAFDSFEDYRDVETLNFKDIWEQEGKDSQRLLQAVHQQGRDNVRTPMQWTDDPHAGFTEGDPWIKVNPNYTKINAEDILQDPDSIYYFYRQLMQIRKDHSTLIYGRYEMIDGNSEQVYAYRRWDEEEEFYIFLNFSEEQAEMIGWPDQKPLHLLSTNYEDEGMTEQLRPWEARIYRAM
jgi:oligo-1,6-glucosidase